MPAPAPTPHPPDPAGRYGWQQDHPGLTDEGRRRLAGARVLISRVGGVGGNVALQLAAAGVRGLILAHGGSLRLDDLNRQILMAEEDLGQPRTGSLRKSLLRFRGDLELSLTPENITPANAERLVAGADLVISCAPLFEERLALNDAAAALGRPLIDAAMYALEGQVTVLDPATGPCLRCLVPEPPPWWRRRFPVFGAVAGVTGCLAATEAIKLLTGLGRPLIAQRLRFDLGDHRWKKFPVAIDPSCPLCSTQAPRPTGPASANR